MAFWHGLYDMDLYDKFIQNDCFTQFEYFEFDYQHITDTCMNLFNNFTDLTEQINIYDVFGVCYNTTPSVEENNSNSVLSTSDIGFSKVGNQLKAYKKYFTAADYTPWAKI
jgi:hypothetical protein